MAEDYSKQGLLDFLDYEREKGLVKDATVSARKAAVSAVFGILSPDEASDLRKVDLDDVMNRFSNLKGAGFTPDSLRTYKSRASSALDDLIKYRKDPAAFRPGISARPARSKEAVGSGEKPNARKGIPEIGTDRRDEIAFPIPIRPGLAVKIVGIPSDLTKREAAKIGSVVMALAQDDDEQPE